jgi:hypothetical protein
VRIERYLAAGASIKEAARKFAINYQVLRRHWRNHVSAEAATYVAGAGASKDQLEEIVADESLGLLDRYRIIRGALYRSLSAAAELGDSNSLALLAGRLHENSGSNSISLGFDCARLRRTSFSKLRHNFGHNSQRGGSILMMSLAFTLSALQDEAGTKSRWSLIPSV